MPNCDSLRKQRDQVDDELTRVTAIVDNPPSPGVLAQMAQRQAELREQRSTLDTLLNQSCTGANPAAAVAAVAPPPAVIRAAEKDHEKALRALTAATLKLSKLSRKDAERQMTANAKGAT